jgi:hypothetical protein
VEIRFGYPNHNSCNAVWEVLSGLSPSFPHHSGVAFAVRASLLPFSSLVADTLEGHSLLSPFEKISLPLTDRNRCLAFELPGPAVEKGGEGKTSPLPQSIFPC